jgi:uncharacterized protein
MKVKTCSAMIKAAGPNEGTEEGVFEAIVAAYNVDSVGDRIRPGAFKKTLEDWKTAGDPIPVLWAHKSDDPEYHIGHVLEAEERPEGLWVKAQIDIDDPQSKSAKVYRLLKGRRVRNFSFSYDEVSSEPAQKDDTGAKKDLLELKVYEVGPCLIGANQQTALISVKHDEPPAAPEPTAQPTVSDVIEGIKSSGGLPKEHVPVLNALLADLAAGMGSLADVLDVLVGPEADEKATPAQPAAVPAPEAKDDAPARPGTASVTRPDGFRALTENLELEADTY